MIHAVQNIDPVIRDLNRYLAEQDQHGINMERLRSVAEKEFHEMNYLEIIEYHHNDTDLECLFEFVINGNMPEAKRALKSFLATVKDAYVENRAKELEQEEEKERQDDEYIERYYHEHGLF